MSLALFKLWLGLFCLGAVTAAHIINRRDLLSPNGHSHHHDHHENHNDLFHHKAPQIHSHNSEISDDKLHIISFKKPIKNDGTTASLSLNKDGTNSVQESIEHGKTSNQLFNTLSQQVELPIKDDGIPAESSGASSLLLKVPNKSNDFSNKHFEIPAKQFKIPSKVDDLISPNIESKNQVVNNPFKAAATQLYETPSESVQNPPVQLYETPSESVQIPVQLYGVPLFEPEESRPVPVKQPPIPDNDITPEEGKLNEIIANTTPAMMLMPFNFDWGVKDEEGGNFYSHSASSDGLVTEGEYSVLLPDGRTQIVSFRDDGHGYQAKIRYE